MNKQPIVEISGVTVSFDGFKALDALDFSMTEGELRFVIGPNGAGKTTLLDVLTGKTRPTQGTVRFSGIVQNGPGRAQHAHDHFNVNVARTSEHALVRTGIGRKFQTPTVFASLTVYENLEVAASFKDGALKLLSALPSNATERIHDVLDLIGLKNRAHARAGMLAHGEKQWLEIGMLLVQEPKLLLLDEPVAGMTRAERNRTGELLREIARRCSVLVVEHDMDFVRNFASTVTVMHLGKLLCQGPVHEVQSDPRVIEVYLGRSRRPAATPTTVDAGD